MKWLTGKNEMKLNKDITYGPWQKEYCYDLQIKLQAFISLNESKPQGK